MKSLSKSLAALVLFGCNAAFSQIPSDLDAVLSRNGFASAQARDALSIYIAEAPASQVATGVTSGLPPPIAANNATRAVNPASVMKLVTSYAALDLLGSTYTWNTPVYIDGAIKDGVLNGNLIIKGVGDPKLVVERLWLLMRRVQGLGIHTIQGDIVLDRSAFDASVDKNPATFDGEALRPYNATPDALLINFKSTVFTFTANPAATGSMNIATVQMDPPLFNVQVPISVPLSEAACGDYRSGLRIDVSNPLRIRFLGSYPKSCGEKVWPLAYTEPSTYAARAVLGMWQNMGGKLSGQVRDGRVSAQAKPVFVSTSPTLAEVLRDVNKLSNNVMAQHVFLTLGLDSTRTGSTNFELSRQVLGNWWRGRYGDTAAAQQVMPSPVIDNGSGLSREERITAQALGIMLQDAWGSSYMPEFVATMPIVGVDGTLRKRGLKNAGIAHLKTGSLRDVVALAGFVHSQRTGSDGKRYVFVGIVNSGDPKVLGAARGALDAAVTWTANR